MSTIILISVGISVLSERQPYLNNLDEVLDDLNNAEPKKLLSLNEFSEDFPDYHGYLETDEGKQMIERKEVNKSYYQGKLNRTGMWIGVSSLFTFIFTFFTLNQLKLQQKKK